MKGGNGWLIARPIAHRGLHDSAQGIVENSLAAARAAAGRGYGVECDVRLSRDGKVFVFHDDRLDRLTGETGAFRDRNSSRLAAITLHGGEKIPTLAAFLAEVAGAVPLILELKSNSFGETALAGAVAAGLADYRGPVALKSFDPAQIASLRAGDPPWPLGVVAQSDYEDEEFDCLSAEQWEELTQFTHAAATRPDFLSWRATDLPTPVVECARACGALPVMTWTIRSPQQANAALKHADQIVFEGFMA